MIKLPAIQGSKTLGSGRATMAVPATIMAAGENLRTPLLEFFAATIRNRNTRPACFRAVTEFFAWVERHQDWPARCRAAPRRHRCRDVAGDRRQANRQTAQPPALEYAVAAHESPRITSSMIGLGTKLRSMRSSGLRSETVKSRVRSQRYNGRNRNPYDMKGRWYSRIC
jgi:hypothetical protein